MNYHELLHTAIIAAIKAGKHIARVYENDFEVEIKQDFTPVTIADKQANDIIEHHLSSTGIVMLGEEGEHYSFDKRQQWEYLWIVDPLDGTKEFVKRNGEFTVNIGLVHKGIPQIGVIFSPVFKDLYFAAEGIGSFKINRHDYIAKEGEFEGFSLDSMVSMAKQLPLQQLPNKFTVVASRSHQSPESKRYINKLKENHEAIETIYTGSSIKMCWIAEGKAHEYPRFGRTMEWDTCAGHCILKYAGGEIIDMHTREVLQYNKENIANPDFLAFRR